MEISGRIPGLDCAFLMLLACVSPEIEIDEKDPYERWQLLKDNFSKFNNVYDDIFRSVFCVGRTHHRSPMACSRMSTIGR